MTDEPTPGGAGTKPPRKLRLPRELSKLGIRQLADDRFRDLAWPMKLPFVRVTHKTKDDGSSAPRADGKPKPLVNQTINFEEPGRSYIHATVRDPRIGMATILDWDIMIFVVSKLVLRADLPGEKQVHSFDRTVTFRPNDLLRSIRRANSGGGRQIKGLVASLARLKNTYVHLQIGSDIEDWREFTLLEDYHRPASSADEHCPEWRVTAPRWFSEQILRPNGAKPAVVRVNPAYFDLGNEPLERVVARWAMAYRGYEAGQPYRMSVARAYKLSTMSEWRKFCPALENVEKRNRLPDHTLKLEDGARGLDLLIDLRPGHEREPEPRPRRHPTNPTPAKSPAGDLVGDGLPDDLADGGVGF